MRDLIEATRTVNRYYLSHLLSVLVLKRMCRHRFYVWIVCYTPARRSTPAFCVNLPLDSVRKRMCMRTGRGDMESPQ